MMGEHFLGREVFNFIYTAMEPHGAISIEPVYHKLC